jgi:hypothetical protein
MPVAGTREKKRISWSVDFDYTWRCERRGRSAARQPGLRLDPSGPSFSRFAYACPPVLSSTVVLVSMAAGRFSDFAQIDGVLNCCEVISSSFDPKFYIRCLLTNKLLDEALTQTEAFVMARSGG